MDERYYLFSASGPVMTRYLYLRNYLPHRPYGQKHGLHVAAEVLPGLGAGRTSRAPSTLVQERFWEPKPAEELYDVRHGSATASTNLTGSRAPPRPTLQRLRRALDEHLL